VALQLEPFSAQACWKSSSVIANLKQDALGVYRDADVDRVRIRMTKDIGEGLLKRAEKRQLRLSRKWRHDRWRGQPGSYPAPLTEIRYQGSQRGKQPEIIQ
jgi:hypothetical protein